MFEIFFRFTGFIIEEILIEGILYGIFALVRLIGLLSLKLITLSNKSFKQLDQYYKDSSKPYFLGLGITAGIIYLIIEYG